MNHTCAVCGVTFRLTSPRSAIETDTNEPSLCPKCVKDAVARLMSDVDRLELQQESLRKTVLELEAERVVVEVSGGSGTGTRNSDESDPDLVARDISQLNTQLIVLQRSTAAARGCVASVFASPKWWKDHANRMWRWAKSLEIVNACRARATRRRDVLAKLQNLTVCNDVFFVWSDAQFGTVNGLRLGNLQGQPVDWVEINAALGYVALLITTIANWSGCQFTEYRVVPQGSFSKLTKVGDERKVHELYMSGRMFSSSRLHTSLKCLLACLKDLAEFACHNDPAVQLPYKITESRIHDLSVDMDNPVRWTRAMKYLLTDLKWLLVWASKWRRGLAV